MGVDTREFQTVETAAQNALAVNWYSGWLMLKEKSW